MFELALRRNQTGFVKLFLDNDFSLTDVFRNKHILPSLYTNNMSEVQLYIDLFTNCYFTFLFSIMILIQSLLIHYEESMKISFNH